MGEEAGTDQLVHGVVTTDVLVHFDQPAGWVERRSGVQATRFVEQGLMPAQLLIQPIDHLRRNDGRAGRQRRATLNFQRLQRGFAAHAAG